MLWNSSLTRIGTSGVMDLDEDFTEDDDDTDALLEQLQRAADEHKRILDRQADLIRRLRQELKGVIR